MTLSRGCNVFDSFTGKLNSFNLFAKDASLSNRFGVNCHFSGMAYSGFAVMELRKINRSMRLYVCVE